MRLGELQRAMRDVLHRPSAPIGSGDPELDEYMARVVDSRRLGVLTHVIRSWREFDLARACPLTTAALRARGLWRQAVESPEVESVGSAFIERLAARFLEVETKNPDPLVASTARFEAAYQAVRRGSDERFVVWWDREPTAVLAQLVAGEPVCEDEQPRGYRMTVARDLPGFFEVVSRIADATTA